VVTVANKQQVIRLDPNVFWHGNMPFVDFNYTYVPSELFGIGAIESFRDLQTALNVITNMDLDNWSMMVNQMYAVHRQADVPPEQLVSRPFGVVYTAGLPKDSIMPIPRQSVAGETTVKQQEMRANIQLASGLTDMHYLGTSSGSRVGQTATGVTAAIEETNTRFQLAVALAEFMTLNPLFQMMASNNQQFMRTSKWVRVSGDTPPEMIHPEDIWGEIDIRFRGAQRIAKLQMEQHNVTNFLRAVGNSPFMLNQLKPRALMKRILPLFFLEDPEEMLVAAPGDLKTPEEENMMMQYGQMVEPSMEEDLIQHLQTHLLQQNHPSFQQWSVESQALMDQHINATMMLAQMMTQSKLGGEMGPAVSEPQMAVGEGALVREAAGVGANPAGGSSDREKGYF
jgi:hypothetical protein